MRIGIDIDDVVYDFDRAAREVLVIADSNPKGSYLPEPLTDKQRLEVGSGIRWDEWDGIERIVGSKNWSWLWEYVEEAGLFQRGYPLPGAIDALGILSERFEVWLMTARSPQWSNQTFTWLYRFDIKAAGVVHGKSKWEVARDLDFRVVVDDGPKNLESYLKMAQEPIYGGPDLYGAYIYGVRRYEPVTSTYPRFRYVESLAEVVADMDEWEDEKMLAIKALQQ